MSESVQLSFPGSSSGAFGVVGGIRNFWHMSHISTHPLSPRSISRCLLPPCFFSPHRRPPPPPVAEKKEKETTACMACRGAEPIRNAALKLPSALCQPAGGPWEFKTRIPGQNQEAHRCPPLVSCLSVMQRSWWLSITPQHAGVAKQPRCIKKRNKRAERQNSQRVKMLRDETQKGRGLGSGCQPFDRVSDWQRRTQGKKDDTGLLLWGSCAKPCPRIL